MAQTMLEIAQQHIGVRERSGSATDPRILEWFADAGAAWVKDDETAWCSAFVCGVAKEGGFFNPKTLRARDWLRVAPENGDAIALEDLLPGDVVVISRGPELKLFHVSIFEGVTSKGALLLCGGNQANGVRVAAYARKRFLGAVRLRHVS